MQATSKLATLLAAGMLVCAVDVIPVHAGDREHVGGMTSQSQLGGGGGGWSTSKPNSQAPGPSTQNANATSWLDDTFGAWGRSVGRAIGDFFSSGYGPSSSTGWSDYAAADYGMQTEPGSDGW